MLKKNTLSVFIGILIVCFLFSIVTVPAYAGTTSTTGKNTAKTQTKIDPKLIEEAKKYGINVTGLKAEDIKKKIEAAKKKLADAQKAAKKPDTSTTAPAPKQNEGNEKVAKEYDTIFALVTDTNITKEDEKKYAKELLKEANELGIDIKGLSIKDAQAKIKAYLDSLDKSDDSNSAEFQALLNAVTAIKTNNQAALLSITQSKILDNALPGLSAMSYEQAKNSIIGACKEFIKIDITKVSLADAKAKILASIREDMKKEAAYYGVDIKGLSDADAQAKIEIAKQLLAAKEIAELNYYAKLYKIDIAGLSKEDAWAKIKAAQMAAEGTNKKGDADKKAEMEKLKKLAEKYKIDISGLSYEEAWKKVKEAEQAQKPNESGSGMEDLQAQAKKFGVDITGLSVEDAWAKIKAAEQALREKEQAAQDAQFLENLKPEAAKYGVDITGLSAKDAFNKVEAAKEAQLLEGLKREADGMGISIAGLNSEDAKAVIRAEKARRMGVDITGLSPAEAEAKLEAAHTAALAAGMPIEVLVMQQIAEGLGIDTAWMWPDIQKVKIGEVLGIDIRNDSYEASIAKICTALNINLTGVQFENIKATIAAAKAALGK